MYIVEEPCMVKTQENQERADSKKWLVNQNATQVWKLNYELSVNYGNI